MKRYLLSLAVGAALATPSFAQTASQFSGPEFEGAVRDYLLANPELLEEMQAALEAKRQAAMREQQVEVLETEADRIFASANDLVLGNPDGDVTIVEFFDYNCGVCRRALSDMQDLIEADPDVRFVLKEWPILGPASMEAHMVSRAVARVAPERYGEFHLTLLGSEGRADGDSAMALVDRMGLDAMAVEAAMDEPETTAPLEEAYELANALGINGTPSYVLPDEVFFGAVGADVLRERIDATRVSAN